MPVSLTRRRSPRPLGFCPSGNSKELFYERMYFREGVRMISALVDQSDSLSVRSNSVTIREDGTSSSCSIRYNPEIMNDANFAKNFNRVPNRVVSARSYTSSTAGHDLDECSLCSRNTGRQQTDVSERTRTGIAEGLRTDITKKQRTDVTERKRTSITDKLRTGITQRSQNNITKKQPMNITQRQRMDITEKQRTDITAKPRTDISEHEKSPTEMCKLQCEVLGSYLCADCIRIRKMESVAQEKRDMYPQIKVDSRSLIAPGKVQHFNSNLPPQFYNERRSLECGCIIHLNENFWNPVIFTETNVFDRIRQASRTNQLLTPVKERGSTTQLKIVGAKRREAAPRRNKALPADLWSYLPVKTTTPRYDMKVTVTFSQKADQIIA